MSNAKHIEGQSESRADSGWPFLILTTMESVMDTKEKTKLELKKMDAVVFSIDTILIDIWEAIAKLKEVDCDVYDYKRDLRVLKEVAWKLQDQSCQMENDVEKLKIENGEDR